VCEKDSDNVREREFVGKRVCGKESVRETECVGKRVRGKESSWDVLTSPLRQSNDVRERECVGHVLYRERKRACGARTLP